MLKLMGKEIMNIHNFMLKNCVYLNLWFYMISSKISTVFEKFKINKNFELKIPNIFLSINCSKEPSHLDHSFEYQQNMFCLRNNNFLIFNLYEPWHEISKNVVCASSKASNRPAHTHSLIRAFASCLNIL